MSVDFEFAPKTKRAPGEPCCEPVVYPDVEREHAARMAAVANALGDPIRLRDAGIVDSERRGLWAYYYVKPEALRELTAWLG